MEDTKIQEATDIILDEPSSKILVPSYIKAEEEQYRSRRRRLKSLSMKSKRRNRRK